MPRRETTLTPTVTVAHAQSAFDHLKSGVYDTNLLMTICVGCSLLAVNVLVLLCVCYHRKVLHLARLGQVLARLRKQVVQLCPSVLV